MFRHHHALREVPTPPISGTAQAVRITVRPPDAEFFRVLCESGPCNVLHTLSFLGIAAEVAQKISGIWYVMQGRLYRERPNVTTVIEDAEEYVLEMKNCWGGLCALKRGDHNADLHAHSVGGESMLDLRFADVIDPSW